VTARVRIIGADPDQAVHPAFGLGIAIGVLALDQQSRRLDARLLAGMIVDQLDLHAVALGPARVHALQHLGPVLAFGAAGAGIDLDIGVVGVGLAGKKGGNLVLLRLVGKLGERGDRVVDQRLVAFRFGKLDHLDRVGQFLLDLSRGGDRLVEPAAFAHHVLRGLGVAPQARILDPVVELVQAPQRAVPVQEAAEQVEGGPDLVDMGLRFGAHGKLQIERNVSAPTLPLILRRD
jgi:hypothetical protein